MNMGELRDNQNDYTVGGIDLYCDEEWKNCFLWLSQKQVKEHNNCSYIFEFIKQD